MRQDRQTHLKEQLEQRRRDIQTEIGDKMRKVRSGAGVTHRVHDGAPDGLGAGVQEDIEFDLIQMNAEIVERIMDALVRLGEGDYGSCQDCGEEIAEKRLRALPFAVRCRPCQDAFEASKSRDRRLDQRAVGSLYGSVVDGYES